MAEGLYVSELGMSAQVSAVRAASRAYLVVGHVAGTFPRANMLCVMLSPTTSPSGDSLIHAADTTSTDTCSLLPFHLGEPCC